jgi:hypothetical protein
MTNNNPGLAEGGDVSEHSSDGAGRAAGDDSRGVAVSADSRGDDSSWDDSSWDDSSWDEAQRNETAMERLDRNWTDLLQELRVIQTGVQLLTGFLLTLPFQARFAELSSFQRSVYLGTLSASVVATGLLIAPVSLHRFLFRQHARRATVATAHRLAQIGLIFLGIAMVGVVLLNFDVVSGLPAGLLAAAAAAVLLASLWIVLPLNIRKKYGRENIRN